MYMAIAVVLIFIAFFIIFRKQIIGLFPRVKSIGKGLVTLDSDQQKTKSEVDPQKEAESLMRQLDNVLIRETEDVIKAELGKKNLLGTEAVPVLIRYVAALSIAYTFSEVYRIIWGSQLNLLDYINSQNPQPSEALRVFYNSGEAQYPLIYSGYPFEQWLGFLKDQLLIREDKGLIAITVRGREFLAYLTTTGLTRNKIG
ncbi:MAG: hypothetical protein A3D92_08750 [Bacteroidetes bacterium RIFCSPHIGHO2_02_FULL_44_7]|nr:MAG: hypothetical protein A3D92_08750 [Bacteroidetes bacterium RIFCSPHIGHO2_02_FULL_44_7]